MQRLLIGLGMIALMASVSAYADKIVLDLKDYDDDLMKDIDRTIKYFEPDIAGQNADGIADDAKVLAEGFAYTEQYFKKKGNYPDAVKWSQEGKDRIAAVLKYVAANNYDAAVLEARGAVQQCKNCHEVYKPVTAR
jgi:hypothetical protein